MGNRPNTEPERATEFRSAADRPASWRWTLCGLLLMATMLNYMDRQTLSLTITDIRHELGLSNEQYGNLEFGFGMAFAIGGLVTGFIVDSVSVRWMYPAVLLGWSLAGVATAYGADVGAWCSRVLVDHFAVDPVRWRIASAGEQAYLGLMICRIALGFFEAGQWPCALVTTQRVLARKDRSFGNSLLQSGAAIGAIFTPLVVQWLVTDEPGTWRGPFVIIGLAGMTWIVPWFALVRSTDLRRPDEQGSSTEPSGAARAVGGPSVGGTADGQSTVRTLRRFAALVVVVIMINATWQFFRVWLPALLREFHEYDRTTVNYFTSAYYIATDAGCVTVGALARWLTSLGWGVHRARMATFLGCALLTSLSTIVAHLTRGPLLLGLLLAIGFGALGLFPNFYSFTQELSVRHQGKVTGILSAATWVITSWMQREVGRMVDATHSYAAGIFWVGLAPLVAFAALALLWGGRSDE